MNENAGSDVLKVGGNFLSKYLAKQGETSLINLKTQGWREHRNNTELTPV